MIFAILRQGMIQKVGFGRTGTMEGLIALFQVTIILSVDSSLRKDGRMWHRGPWGVETWITSRWDNLAHYLSCLRNDRAWKNMGSMGV